MSAETQHRIDVAVLAHRSDPSDENRQTLMEAMDLHHEEFLRTQTIDFMDRTMNSPSTQPNS